MSYNGTAMEMKTNLVSYKLFFGSIIILYLSGVLFLTSLVVGDGDSRWIQNRKIGNHMLFKYLQKHKFIVDNYELLRKVGYGLSIVSVIVAFFSGRYAFRSYNLGFFKLNPLRANVNGSIFQLEKIQSLKFTINSPKVFGDRSAKQGFQNWIEFVHNGERYKYEFFLKNTVMEDELLSLLEEIKNTYGSVEIKIMETQKSWFRKLQEELGIDPQ